MEEFRSRAGRLRRGAGALLISLAVVAAVTAGYFGLRHDAASGDGGGPAARAGAAVAYDPATDDVVMFGGTSAAGQPLADTWLWDGSVWSEAAPADSPPARYGAEMAWDPQSQRVVLLGGSGGSGCSIGSGSSGTVSTTGGCPQLQDAWAWDGSDWAQIALGHGSGQLGDYTLAGASMTTDPTSGKLILVTADSPASVAVPLPAIYNGSSGGEGASAAAPPVSSAVAVSGSASATGTTGGVCIAVGGGPCGSPVALPSATASTSPAQTACPLDGGCESSACPAPPAAESTTGCPISCATAMIACPICPATASPAAGVANPAVACPICPVTASPEPGVATPAIASICGICPETPAMGSPATGTEVICSNCPLETSCPALAATLTWVFDGTTFQLADSSAGDSPASGGQLAWFPGPGLLVDLGADLGAVAGGPAIPPCPSDAPCPLIPAAEDWQWTGSGWTPVQDLPANAAARYFQTPPVSDTAAGEVVALDYTGALWVSTNPAAGWVEAPSAGAPAPRSEPALASDGSTGQVVLFGGELAGSTSAAGEVMGDTWTWDGTSWTEQEGGAPTPTPSATPVPTTTGVPDLPPLPSASAVAGSPSPSATASVSASPAARKSPAATAQATTSASALPAIAPITG
jgi:hypothetical protein